MKEKINKSMTNIFKKSLSGLQITIIILVLIGAGIGIWKYQEYRNLIKDCKQKCTYIPTIKSYNLKIGLGSRKFPDLDECLDYCMDNSEELTNK